MAKCKMCCESESFAYGLCSQCVGKIAERLCSCDRCGARMLPGDSGLCDKCQKLIREESQRFTVKDKDGDELTVSPAPASKAVIFCIREKGQATKKCVVVHEQHLLALAARILAIATKE